MSNELYTCGICEKDIVVEYLDDIHSDDSGEYHTECHDKWADAEAQYWSAYYRPDPFRLSKQEQLDAYEPGSAKRYAMELELSVN